MLNINPQPGQRRACRRQQISRCFGEALPECRGGCDVCAEAPGAGTGGPGDRCCRAPNERQVGEDNYG